MKDPRITELACSLVHYATELKKGDKVLIHMNGSHAEPLVDALVKECVKAGALPFVSQTNERLLRSLLMDIQADSWISWPKPTG